MQSYIRELGGLISIALIFMVAFLWQDALIDLFDHYFPGRRTTFGKIIYVLIITIISAALILWLNQRYDTQDSIAAHLV